MWHKGKSQYKNENLNMTNTMILFIYKKRESTDATDVIEV